MAHKTIVSQQILWMMLRIQIKSHKLSSFLSAVLCAVSALQCLLCCSSTFQLDAWLMWREQGTLSDLTADSREIKIEHYHQQPFI